MNLRTFAAQTKCFSAAIFNAPLLVFAFGFFNQAQAHFFPAGALTAPEFRRSIASSHHKLPEHKMLGRRSAHLQRRKKRLSAISPHFSGIASWYGGEFLGRQTASGDVFDADHFTAASRWLPFGTKLLVGNRENGKWVKVVVNDRGPYVDNRVLDLSPAAAEKLGMVTAGLSSVIAYIVK